MAIRFFREPAFRVLIVTGTCRVGKTTLSKKLATNDRFEFLDEAWLPMFLPVLVKQGEMAASLAKSMLNSYFDELGNDVFLCRRANFRPGDSSTIWDFKSAKAIFHRLTMLESRADAKKWAEDNNTVLVLALPEVSPFIQFFLDASEKTHVLLLEREQKNLAKAIADKKWYSDEQLLAPVNNQPYTGYALHQKHYHMPWWLNSDQFDAFIHADDLARANMYTQYFYTEADQQQSVLNKEQRKRFIKFESEVFFRDEASVISRIHQFFE